jgi:hypothetical protein
MGPPVVPIRYSLHAVILHRHLSQCQPKTKPQKKLKAGNSNKDKLTPGIAAILAAHHVHGERLQTYHTDSRRVYRRRLIRFGAKIDNGRCVQGLHPHYQCEGGHTPKWALSWALTLSP